MLGALHRYAVLLFREQQISFGRRFGEIRVAFCSRYRLPGYREFQPISNIVEDVQSTGLNNAGSLWHTDHSFARYFAVKRAAAPGPRM